MSAVTAVNSYATDGKCHNAEPGTYGHECGKPATWIGTTGGGFASGYCADCKANGTEARLCVEWKSVDPPAGYAAEYRNNGVATLYGYGETEADARNMALTQISGAGRMYTMIRRRIFIVGLSADLASEVCEMLSTPW